MVHFLREIDWVLRAKIWYVLTPKPQRPHNSLITETADRSDRNNKEAMSTINNQQSTTYHTNVMSEKKGGFSPPPTLSSNDSMDRYTPKGIERSNTVDTVRPHPKSIQSVHVTEIAFWRLAKKNEVTFWDWFFVLASSVWVPTRFVHNNQNTPQILASSVWVLTLFVAYTTKT